MATSLPATVDTARPAAIVSGARNRRLDIQGLRAVAVLMVLAFHAGLPVPGGFVGVDVFFVISGFVITAMLMREWNSTGRIRLWRFYVRRFKRLTPALAVTVVAVMVASSLLLSPLGGQQTAAKTAIGAMLLVANAVIERTTGGYFGERAETNPLLNTWSLSVEEQFYLVFPAILLIGWLLGRRAGRQVLLPAIVVGLVGMISFVLAIGGSIGVLKTGWLPDELTGFYGPATRAWEFAVGALLALGGERLAVSSRGPARAISLAGAGLLIASLFLITGDTPFPGPWTTLPVVGTALLLVTGSVDTRLTRALAHPAMVAIGDRSYSIYLWHWPVIVFAHLQWPGSEEALLLAAVLSLLPAYASYRWVEQPFRGLPYEKGLPLLGLVAAAIIPPLILAGGLGIAVRNGFWLPQVRQYQAVIPYHAAGMAGCTNAAWRHPERCVWPGDVPSGRPIYLVGDSNADHFSEALIGTAKSISRKLVFMSEDGCAYLPPSSSYPEIDPRCIPYQTRTEKHLRGAEPGTVVIANSYLAFRDERLSSNGEESDEDLSQRLRLDDLAQRLSRAVTSLREAGHSVLLVQATPHWPSKESGSSRLRV